jgi:hypothetical protein
MPNGMNNNGSLTIVSTTVATYPIKPVKILPKLVKVLCRTSASIDSQLLSFLFFCILKRI